MPLKGIPSIISPDLLKVLAEMGHGDQIVLADAHFPTSSICACGPKEIRADGHGIPSLLEAILQLFPLDHYIPKPVLLMEKVPSDSHLPLPIWDEYRVIIDKADTNCPQYGYLERFQFYDQAKKAFAVIHTGELAQYGNIILTKGIVSS